MLSVSLQPLFPWFLTLALVSAAPMLRAQSPSSGVPARPALNMNPVADPAAMVVAGHARFTVLTPELLRMEWAQDNRFEDHASLIFLNRRLRVPAFTRQNTGTGVVIDTGKLKLVFQPAADDTGFTAANLAVTLNLNGAPVTWHPGTESKGNLLGTTRTLDGARGGDLHEPMEPGLVSREGWSVVDDHGPLFNSADFRAPHQTPANQPWVLQRRPGSRQDLYFFGYGHNYRRALGDYVRVAGRIPLPPRFAFGAWWSRYWAYSDQELRELVNGFHQDNVPLDVLVIDMDWHKTFGRNFQVQDASGHAKGWSGYSWDDTLFPDPKDFLAELHKDGLKVTLNLHPASGVQPWEQAYPQFAKNMGVDPATKTYIPFDLTDRRFAENYVTLLHHPLEQQGVDFWWLDWQQEKTTRVSGVNPTWWLNYIHFTDQEHEGKRPLLFHRWGGLGNHRYQIGFSGDTISVWDSLAFQPWFTATAANVGYAYWSHDIGGHMPGAVDPELYTRWIQFGIFSPILRTHTTKNAEAERRIWAYPEPYSDIMRSSFQLRYAMQPYLYTEGRRTFDTGVAFLRPLYYDFPEAPEAYSSRGEYLFGETMLVAPVVQPADPATGLATESVWVPPGDWIEFFTGKRVRGPVTLDRSYSVDQIPLFVKAGAILPMQPPMEYTGQKPVDPLILTVAPLADQQTSRYTLYEDSGHSEDYQQNIGTAWTDITTRQNGDVLTVTVAPVRGGYAGMLRKRGYELRLPGDWPPSSVAANGVPVRFALDGSRHGWRFEGNTLTTVVPVPASDVHRTTKIVVRRDAGSLSARAQLDGFAGRLHRLREAYDALSQDFPATAAVPDEVSLAMQTGERLRFRPATAREEVSSLPGRYVEALRVTLALRDEKTPSSKVAAAPPSDASRKLAEHRHRLDRAIADLQAGKP